MLVRKCITLTSTVGVAPRRRPCTYHHNISHVVVVRHRVREQIVKGLLRRRVIVCGSHGRARRLGVEAGVNREPTLSAPPARQGPGVLVVLQPRDLHRHAPGRVIDVDDDPREGRVRLARVQLDRDHGVLVVPTLPDARFLFAGQDAVGLVEDVGRVVAAVDGLLVAGDGRAGARVVVRVHDDHVLVEGGVVPHVLEDAVQGLRAPAVRQGRRDGVLEGHEAAVVDVVRPVGHLGEDGRVEEIAGGGVPVGVPRPLVVRAVDPARGAEVGLRRVGDGGARGGVGGVEVRDEEELDGVVGHVRGRGGVVADVGEGSGVEAREVENVGVRVAVVRPHHGLVVGHARIAPHEGALPVGGVDEREPSVERARRCGGEVRGGVLVHGADLVVSVGDLRGRGRPVRRVPEGVVRHGPDVAGVQPHLPRRPAAGRCPRLKRDVVRCHGPEVPVREHEVSQSPGAIRAQEHV